MIHRLLLCFTLAFIPLISSAQKKIEVKDPEIKFSYLLPDGWEVKDNGYTYEIHSPESKDAYISITYVESAQGSDYIESLGEKLSFEEDFDFELSYVLTEEYSNLTVGEKGKTTIDETPALWARFQSTDNGDDRISIFYMFQKHDKTFKITGTASAEHFEKIQPYFTSIIKSLNTSKV